MLNVPTFKYTKLIWLAYYVEYKQRLSIVFDISERTVEIVWHPYGNGHNWVGNSLKKLKKKHLSYFNWRVKMCNTSLYRA